MFGKKLMAKTAKPMMLAGALAAFVAAQPAQAAVTQYSVTQWYNQVTYDSSFPTADTYFTGSFSFDSDSNTVTGLSGWLTQAMETKKELATPGYHSSTSPMHLTNQVLPSFYDASRGGIVVSTFLLNTTSVFSDNAGYASTVGYEPRNLNPNNLFASGPNAGQPKVNGGTQEIIGANNAYVTIFVPLNPLTALTSAQLNTLSYGDCTTGSLMGMGMGAKTCMTGFLTAGSPLAVPAGMAGGTMMGTDQITQTISAVPEPETYALFLAGLGLMGMVVRRRRAIRVD